MSVVNVWVGATHETGALVVAKVTGTSVRIAVREDGVAGVQYYGPVLPTAEGVVRVPVTGLDPNTRYTFRVEEDGLEDEQFPGQFQTHPIVGTPASYTYGMATCAGATPSVPGVSGTLAPNRMSNGTIFDTMREKALAENWLFFMHGGDMHYYDLGSGNHGITGGGSLANYRRGYDDVLLQPRQHALYRNVPLVYAWDDHDFGPNDGDSTIPGRDNACQVYREKLPYYELPSATGGIYQSFQVGRVLYIVSDVRAYRDPNSAPQVPGKTMLGAEQKAWMEQVLTADNGAEALVWLTPSQWVSTSHADSWLSFPHERDELVQLFGDTGWLSRMVVNSGDAHALAIDTGRSNSWGGFPIYQFASMDCAGSAGPPFDTGPNLPGRDNYGTMRINDNGHTIQIIGTGWHGTELWRSHSFYADVGTPVLALDYTKAHISPPFEPTDDDQRTVNDVTAKRMEGGEARSVVTEGPMSVNPPPLGVGRYDQSVELNVETDDQLPGQAGWRTHLGTVDEYRYPRIRVDLTRNTDLREEVTSLDSGDKIIIDNPPPWLPPEPIEALVEGYTEEIDLFSWNVVMNASPASPFEVGELEEVPSEAGPAHRNRVDTPGSSLVYDVDEGETEMVVVTDQNESPFLDRWINSYGPGLLHADEFPFDIRLNGEVASVEASASLAFDAFDRTESGGWGTSDSGQVWTSEGDGDRSVSAGVAVIEAASALTGQRFQLLDEEVLGDSDIIVDLAIGEAPAGATNAACVVTRYESASNAYFARIHFTVAGNVFCSFVTSAGQVDGNASAGLTYAPGDMFRVRVQQRGHRMRVKVWPVAVAEPEHWQLDRTAVAGLLESGYCGVMGYALSGVSNPTQEYRFSNFEVWNPQRFTVERGINTVDKSHPAGTPLALDKPAVIGL